MKQPNFEVDNVSNSQNLEEAADDIIQEGYQALEDAIESLLGVNMEHPHSTVVYFSYEDHCVTVHHGKGPVSYHIAGDEVDQEEFVDMVSESDRQRFKKAIGIYAALSDVQNQLVSEDLLSERYG